MSMSSYPGQGPAERPPQGQREQSTQQRLQEASRRAEEAGQRAGEAVREAGQRTRRVRNSLYRGTERARILTAEGLARAAAGLRSSSTGTDTTARHFADSLDRGATYLRQTDLNGMQRDAALVVREHPWQALGAAFVVGFLVGRGLSRD